jgi:hypothetical protein
MSKSRVDEIKHSNQTPAAEKPTYHADIPTYPRVFEFGLNSGIPAAGVSAPCRLNKTQQSNTRETNIPCRQGVWYLGLVIFFFSLQFQAHVVCADRLITSLDPPPPPPPPLRSALNLCPITAVGAAIPVTHPARELLRPDRQGLEAHIAKRLRQRRFIGDSTGLEVMVAGASEDTSLAK